MVTEPDLMLNQLVLLHTCANATARRLHFFFFAPPEQFDPSNELSRHGSVIRSIKTD